MSVRTAIRALSITSLMAVTLLQPLAASGAEVAASGAGIRSDFNGDGFADLAVGVPMESNNGFVSTGGLNVLYATDTGLASGGNQFWDQPSSGSTDGFLDQFGSSSVSGDFNGDGFWDLAVGIPLENIAAADDAGAINVIYGSASGLTSAASRHWHQDRTNVEDVAETLDQFGSSLATGDFDGDGIYDLAIGVPGETVGGNANAGAVNILHGSLDGIRANLDQFWHQDSANVNNIAEAGDEFGRSVAVADFNGDGVDDLAVGVPGEDLGGGADAGAVNVLYGSSPDGLTSAEDDFWNQDVAGINNTAETGDAFGYGVATGDFDGDLFQDLMIGVPLEDLTGGANAGGASVIYGTANGLDAAEDDFWNQDSTGINNEAEADDWFGITLAAGDFDGNGRDDAAIGVSGEDVAGAAVSGAVAVIYGTASGLDDPANDFWHQDSAGILDSSEAGDCLGTSLRAENFGNGPEDDLAIGVAGEDLVGDVVDAGAVNVIYGSPSDLTSTGNQFWSQDSPDILDVAESEDSFGWGPAASVCELGPGILR